MQDQYWSCVEVEIKNYGLYPQRPETTRLTPDLNRNLNQGEDIVGAGI